MGNVYLGTMSENPLSNIVGEDKLTWFKSSSQYRALETIDGESMEFECNIFQGFTTLQLCNKIQELRSRISVQQENFTGRIIFMSMFNDISWWSKDNEKMRIKRQTRFDLCEKIFIRKMVIPRTWIKQKVVFCSWKQTTKRLGQSRRADDDQIRRKRIPSLPIHESIIQRSVPKQRWWKIINTHLRWWGDGWNSFSHNCFCWSAQYMRSSLRFVWRIQILACYNRETCFWQHNLTHCLCPQAWWKH